MAASALQLLQIADDLRKLARRLTAMLNDSTDAAGMRTWVGPAADHYRYSISGRRTELEQVASDLLVVADRIDHDQKLMMAGAA